MNDFLNWYHERQKQTKKTNLSLLAKSEINLLIEFLKKRNHEYYVASKPTISDANYDLIYKLLQWWETKFPKFISTNSPTQKITENFNEKFKKIKHSEPMLSIENGFNEKDIENFLIRNKKKISNIKYCLEPKIDGVSICLYYEDGKLVKALTRGNGEYGEYVTKNLKSTPLIPKVINFKKSIEIRGEIYIDIENLWKIQKYLKTKIISQRNIASGLVRNQGKTNQEFAKKFQPLLNFYPYSIINPTKYSLFTQNSIFDFFKKNGFNENKYYQVVSTLTEMLNFYNKINDLTIQKQINYFMDGITIKCNEFLVQKQLGATSKFPRWIIAWKFPEVIKATKLKGVELTIGKSGKLVYVGILDKVIIDNTYVSRVTLNNYLYIKENNLNINDTVLIKKSGGIIPKLHKVIHNNNNKTIKIIKTTNCPFCKWKLLDTEREQFCTNKHCPEIQLRKLIFYCSKDGLDIEGLGEQIIRAMFKKKILLKIEDIYYLEKNFDKYLNVQLNDRKLTLKVFKNIINSINNSKKQDFSKLLTALSIKFLGKTSANLICENFLTIQDLLDIKLENILAIKNIGIKTATNLYDYLNDPKNIKLFSFLDSQNVNLISSKTKTFKHNLKKQIFVITGKLSQSRKYYENVIAENNGIFHTNISKHTSYLITNNPLSNSNKLNDAKKFQIKIINEKEFANLLK